MTQPIDMEIINGTLACQRFDGQHLETNWFGSTFESVHFSNCRLDRVTMRRSKWRRCTFESSVMVVDFTDSVFDDCSFRASTIKGLHGEYGGVRASFTICDFSGTTFRHVNIRASRFHSCCFTGTTFISCDLRGALHDGVQILNTDGSTNNG